MLRKEQLERLIDIMIEGRIPGQPMDKEDTEILNHLLTMTGDLGDIIRDLISLSPSDLTDPDKIETEICQLLRIQDLTQDKILNFTGLKVLAYTMPEDTDDAS